MRIDLRGLAESLAGDKHDDSPHSYHLSDHSVNLQPPFPSVGRCVRARARATKDLKSGTPSLIAPKHPTNDGNKPGRKAEGKGLQSESTRGALRGATKCSRERERRKI